MHWRKVPSRSKVFYVVVLALTGLVTVSTVLLAFSRLN
jgi:hypothetical protein